MQATMKKTVTVFAALAALATAPSAQAASIFSPGDPLLSGSTTITFSEVAPGTLNPTIFGVSFSGVSANTVVSSFGGPNPRLTNQTDGIFGTTVLIQFGTGVSAFGTDLLRVNSNTTLEAFDSNNILLGSVLLIASGTPAIDGFRGLGGFGTSIASARIVTTDFLSVDNFQFVSSAAAVPEPGTWAMLILGFGTIGFAMRRRAATAKASRLQLTYA